MPDFSSENAFDTLLHELENSIDATNQEGAKAFKSGDYNKAQILMEKGKALNSLAIQMAELRTQWNKLLETEKPKQATLLPVPDPKPKKSETKKMMKGLRTHEEAYRLPLLQALAELGGSSNLNAVIVRVGEIMKPILNEYDYMPLKSDPETPRWRNATQWVRFSLVKEGLMEADSSAGTWEISPKGRQWLKQQQSKP